MIIVNIRLIEPNPELFQLDVLMRQKLRKPPEGHVLDVIVLIQPEHKLLEILTDTQAFEQLSAPLLLPKCALEKVELEHPETVFHRLEKVEELESVVVVDRAEVFLEVHRYDGKVLVVLESVEEFAEDFEVEHFVFFED